MAAERARSVVAVILAAGRSARLGTAKQLLELDGKLLLQAALDAAADSGASSLVLVLGADHEAIAGRIDLRGARLVVNGGWQEGIASSIRAGVKEALGMRAPVDSWKSAESQSTVESRIDGAQRGPAGQPRGAPPHAVLFLVCDQPFVTAKLLSQIIDAFASSGKGIVCCRYGGELGVPALFSARYFAELSALSGDTGARRIIKAHKDDVHAVDFQLGEYDIDTDADWRAAREIRSQRQS